MYIGEKSGKIFDAPSNQLVFPIDFAYLCEIKSLD
jgi:hypothetical protein